MSGEPDPHSREHAKWVLLAAPLYIAVQRCSVHYEISQKAAILRLLTEGAHTMTFLSDADHKLLAGRYERKLVDVIAEKQAKREPSHMPVLDIEKVKVELKASEYPGLSPDELQQRYDRAAKSRDYTVIQMVKFEAKRREIRLRGDAI